MENTIKINLGGTLFRIEEDAYTLLRNYLQALDHRLGNSPEKNESIEDIELRIAEIFQSQKPPSGIIIKDNVDAAISIIGKPDDIDLPETGQFTQKTPYGLQKKRLFRNQDDKIIGGVCGGIGEYLNIAPVWIRVFFVIFTLFFGAGVLIYVVLWIALPLAITESDRKEMYGSNYYSANRYARDENNVASRIGNAFNEIFRAVVRVLFVFVRAILIILGVSLVVSAFLALVAFVMVFIFKIPGAFTTNIEGNDLSYLPDFLKYIVSPQLASWISVLASIVIILPILALIYWAVRMIFWIRVKDAVFNLAALVIWVISIAALTIIVLSEGVNYAEASVTTINDEMQEPHDTLYIKSATKLSDLGYDYLISVPGENYDMFLKEDGKEVFIRTFVKIVPSENQHSYIEVNKRSTGRNRSVAGRRSEALICNFREDGNTIFIDEYSAYPSGMKWGFDKVSTKLSIPAGTIIGIDADHECFLHHGLRHTDYDKRFWKITEEGLEPSI